MNDKDKKISELEENIAIGKDINNRLMNEVKVFEDLYYKENAKVGLLQAEVDYLKKHVDFLNATIAYNNKYSK